MDGEEPAAVRPRLVGAAVRERVTPEPISFVVSGAGTLDTLLAALEGSHRIESGAPREEVSYDSFDWRLYRKGLRLLVTREKKRFHVRLETGDRTLEGTLEAEPVFARDFGDGPMGRILAKALSIRRVMPVARVKREPRSIQFLNEDRKIIARMQADELQVAAPEGAARWQTTGGRWVLSALRGYESETERIRRQIEALPDVSPDEETEIDHVLAALGRKSASYSSKFHLELSGATPAGLAVRQILKELFHAMQANHAGTIADLDPEFLHDFRVAGRRTRSCIGQLKRTLPMDRVEPLRGEFSWLGKVTGPTRDLDVFAMDLDDLFERLSDREREHLAPLRQMVLRDRGREQLRLAAQLRSKRYLALVDGWEAFVTSEPVPGEAEHADHPIIEIAAERIQSKYRRMVKRGRKLDARRATEALHELRIEGKKLRYLLEFFRSLFPHDAIDPLIVALKRLQDHLGDFNDIQMQQKMLEVLTVRLEGQARVTAATFVTLGRQLEGMARRERRLRTHFAEEFESFQNRKTAARVARLLPKGVTS